MCATGWVSIDGRGRDGRWEVDGTALAAMWQSYMRWTGQAGVGAKGWDRGGIGVVGQGGGGR